MFILFGPAGSGKSLQGQILAEKYGWRWLSVGQLLRDQKNPNLDKIMKEGGLVDDNFVVNMMHDAIKASEYAEQNAILDGYPRDVWQANWLVEHGDLENVEGAIILNVTKEELWKRLEARGRVDDKKDAIEKRWSIFEQTIAEMSRILEGEGLKIEKIDGVGAIEQITERIETVLRKWGTI
ncbi:nucleoside monophosphate kinase [Candidatus Saccharibacteria bacterium]|jgi:adenylate kinase|nr:nucleoside monophosphate kinase [Candidatus Saccharibacteria bacterium]